jgi:RNA polymerase sigma-32 factor
MKQKTPISRKTSKSSSNAPKRAKAGKSKPLSPEVLPVEQPEDEEEVESSDIEDPSDAEIASSIPSAPVTNLEPEVSAVSANDPLRRYLEEIRRYPLLEPSEEFSLTMKLREQGDLQAARALVSANLRLVVKIAFEYRTFYSNLLDLIQEGNIGLMKAVSKFDPTKGARLGYYASWWIRSYILKYLLDNFRLVKVGTTQAQKKLFYHLMREKERLEAQGLLAGPKLLAEKLNVREKDVVEMEQRLSGRGVEMSLDAPVDHNTDKPTSHLDLLADDQDTADEVLAKQQLLKLLHDRLPAFQKILNDKELRILKDRLLSDEPKTLQEVADLYGLTRERARQIEVKVIEKLRDYLKSVF